MKRLSMNIIITLLVIYHWSFVICAPARADVPKIMNIQGKLTDPNSKAVSGAKKLRCSLVDNKGAAVFNSKVYDIPLNSDGVFNVDIDISSTLADFNSPYTLNIIIINEDGSTSILEPKALTSAPYVLNAGMLGGLKPASFAAKDADGKIVGSVAGYVKKSGDEMSGGLKVNAGKSNFGIESSGKTAGVKGLSASSGDRWGALGGENYGVYGQSTANAIGIIGVYGVYGVYGSGKTFGGYFQSSTGIGAIGKTTGANGGVFGGYNTAEANDKWFGVAGASDSGNGIYGEVASNTLDSDWKAGVYGKGSNTTSGVFGYTDSTSGAGVKGVDNSGYGAIFSGEKGVKVDGPVNISGTITANNLPGIAYDNYFNFSNTNLKSSTAVIIKSVEIDVPAPGYILVQSSGTLYSYATTDVLIGLGILNIDNFSSQVFYDVYFGTNPLVSYVFLADNSKFNFSCQFEAKKSMGPNIYFPFSTSNVFETKTAGKQKFYLTGYLKPSASSGRLDVSGSIQAIYFPSK